MRTLGLLATVMPNLSLFTPTEADYRLDIFAWPRTQIAISCGLRFILWMLLGFLSQPRQRLSFHVLIANGGWSSVLPAGNVPRNRRQDQRSLHQ
jgi:hypothetical protein